MVNTDTTKCSISSGITQYGKGYFEWQAEGEGCTEININFTVKVRRQSKSNGDFVYTNAQTSFNHKVTVVNYDDPPYFVVTPDNFVSFEESTNNKYQYKVKVKDPEVASPLAFSCTVSTSGTTISGSLTYNNGSESIIEWTHNPSLGFSYSGKISCEIRQTTDSCKKKKITLILYSIILKK